VADKRRGEARGLGWQALQQRHIFPPAANAGEQRKSSLDCQPQIYPELGVFACPSNSLGASSVAVRRGERRGSSRRRFQPSALCFAMVSKFVLLSWLLMMRLAPCRSEPSLLWGIGPECWMKGGGEEIVSIAGFVWEVNELRESPRPWVPLACPSPDWLRPLPVPSQGDGLTVTRFAGVRGCSWDLGANSASNTKMFC